MATKPCVSCANPIPADDRFCGKCGSPQGAAPAPAGAGSTGKTMFFAPAQPTGPKLILIKTDSAEGVSYQLNGAEHVVGRDEGAIVFPGDSLVSPRHANFVCRDGKLFVRDEGSTNGVFIRIRGAVQLDSGSMFVVGEQHLQIEASAPDMGPQPDSEGTYFYASPKRASRMRVVQRLRGGETGIVFRAREECITVGRESNDMNFPNDPFISGRHAKITIEEDGRFTLTDVGSKNGTFMKIADEQQLGHGDYVFLGKQLLRVELS